jgi:hypothetical protein
MPSAEIFINEDVAHNSPLNVDKSDDKSNTKSDSILHSTSESRIISILFHVTFDKTALLLNMI